MFEQEYPEEVYKMASKETPELENGRLVAQEKLHKITDSNFNAFALRFMSLAEYEEMLRNGSARPHESSILEEHIPQANPWTGKIRHERYDQSVDSGNTMQRELVVEEITQQEYRKRYGFNFTKFLSKARKNWTDTVYEYTLWRPAQQSLVTYDSLQQILKQARKTAKEKGFNAESIYTETMSAFKQRIDEMYQLFPPALYRIIKRGDWNPDDYQSLQTIREYQEDPEFLLKDRGNLRRLIHAITYCHDDLVKLQNESNKNDLMAEADIQYEVAVVFDVNQIAEIQSHNFRENWGHIKGGKLEGENILAAIAIIPNKELHQKIVDLSSHGESLSHPVFDSKGVIRYPEV